MPRTKILATLGPATDTDEGVAALIQNGVDAVRLNMSHGTLEDHARHIDRVRRLAAEQSRRIALLLDLQGPRMRLGEIEKGELRVEAGARLRLTPQERSTDPDSLPLPHPKMFSAVSVGDRLFLADGEIELQVRSVGRDSMEAEIVSGGALRSRQGINAPDTRLELPVLTDQDRAHIGFAVEQMADYLALSFVGTAEDVAALRQEVRSRGGEIPVVAKIERAEALDHLDEILEAADGIMVARGDLGVETSLAELPILQKQIIRRANRRAVPIITATQILDSMITHTRPTRAEASDVANAILDGSDALLLAGETAIGVHPTKAVQAMVSIATKTEEHFPYLRDLKRGDNDSAGSVTDAVSQAVCQMAHDLDARAIITTTSSGHTARMVARHRPKTPIIAVSSRPETCQRLALVWGVEAHAVAAFEDTDALIETSLRVVQEKGIVAAGDTVVITAGVPHGEPGRTNMIKVHRVS